jgi:hypothetical protein
MENVRIGEYYIMRCFIIIFLPNVLMLKQYNVGCVYSAYDIN